jgi:hypothetical protein
MEQFKLGDLAVSKYSILTPKSASGLPPSLFKREGKASNDAVGEYGKGKSNANYHYP